MERIPMRFPTRLLDRISYYMSYMGDPMIHLALDFGTQLDADRLAKAIDLTLDAEPVLGCRFVKHWRLPYWERLDASERESFIFTTDEAEYSAFKSASIDPHQGPQIKVGLWRSSIGDRLLLKAVHYAADGGGVKETIAIISSIYSLLANEPSYQPRPNLKSSRSLRQVLRHVPWHAYPQMYLTGLRDSWAQIAWKGTPTLPLKGGPPASLVFVERPIPRERVASLTDYGRKHEATLNDMVLTAFFRALAAEGNWDGRSHLSIITTVDLRKWYLPTGRGEAVANLSGIEYPTLGTELGTDFAATLQRVIAITHRQKAKRIGLNQWVIQVVHYTFWPSDWGRSIWHKVFQQQIKKHNVWPIFTNLGDIALSSVTFEAAPLEARLMPPPGYPPQFMVGLSGYEGTLTLSAGVDLSQKEIVERFFDRVLLELPP